MSDDDDWSEFLDDVAPKEVALADNRKDGRAIEFFAYRTAIKFVSNDEGGAK